jgi:hypothetical protein
MEIKEIRELITDIGYKYCSLWKNGDPVEAWNNQYMTIDEKLDQIEKRLKALASGTYQVRCRNSSRSKIDSFDLNWGNSETNLSETMPEVSSKYLENTEILKLSIENANLRKDCERYQDQIADLEDTIAELQSQIKENASLLQEKETPTLMENAKSFVETLMEYGVPLLNQHWELQKQKMEIEKAKLGMRTAPRTQAPDPEKIKIRIIGEWVESKKDDQEVYNALHDISAKSSSVDQFLQLVAEYNMDLYAELSEQI